MDRFIMTRDGRKSGVFEKNPGTVKKLATVLLIFLMLFTVIPFSGSAYGASQQTGTVVTEALNVRSGPGTLNESLGLLYEGSTVTILGTEKDYAGGDWYRISYYGTEAYVSADYIEINSMNEYVYDKVFEEELTAQGFPESYKTYLRNLHADYPEWVFKAAHTNLDWDSVIDKESQVGVNLVPGSSVSSWKSMEKGAYDFETGSYVVYDTGNWVSASRQIIEHYMDPRNFLNASGIFQFLAHSYDGTTQTAAGLAGVLAGTFMSGSFPESGYDTYNEVLMKVGKETNVNPYVLASMIIVEQGSSGSGKSISGTVSGYEGYYNHFNIGAYATGTMDAVTRGLWYASQSGAYGRPWNSRYKSIAGGAAYYSQNYVQNNKYTLYLKKFNVMNGASGVGTGQYMTNVQGAESEAAALRKGYASVLESPMTFIIPVYENMPESACLKPTSSGSNNNYLSKLSVTGYDLTPIFNRYVTEYELVVDADTEYVDVIAGKSSASATISGGGRIYLDSSTKNAAITVTAPSGVTRTYTITISKAAGGQDNTEVSVSGSYQFGDYLTGVDFSTSYASFMKNIEVKNGSARLKNADGKVITSGTVATGMTLEILDKNGKQADTYDVVIKGDVSGDGKISSVDPLTLQKHIVGSRTMKGAYLKAADINGDGRANSLDVLYIQKHIVGSYSIKN